MCFQCIEQVTVGICKKTHRLHRLILTLTLNPNPNAGGPGCLFTYAGDNCILIHLPAHPPAFIICLKCALICLSEKHNLFKNITEMRSLEGLKSHCVAFSVGGWGFNLIPKWGHVLPHTYSVSKRSATLQCMGKGKGSREVRGGRGQGRDHPKLTL